MEKIKFKQISEDKVEIIAVFGKELGEREIVIGDIFSDGSYSGKSSIQICGFDRIEGAWSCGRYNHSQDCCLVWNDIEQFLKKKGGLNSSP